MDIKFNSEFHNKIINIIYKSLFEQGQDELHRELFGGFNGELVWKFSDLIQVNLNKLIKNDNS